MMVDDHAVVVTRCHSLYERISIHANIGNNSRFVILADGKPKRQSSNWNGGQYRTGSGINPDQSVVSLIKYNYFVG